MDDMPSFEYYPMMDGRWVDRHLADLLQDLLQDLILPYVRANLCGTCTAAEVLVRCLRLHL